MIYFDARKKEQFQRAKAVVLCANGAETPRLLFNSASNRFPFQQYPIIWGLRGLPNDGPTWGGAYKKMLGDYFNRSMQLAGQTTSLPVPTNNITLDPTAKDDGGIPALRVTYTDHPDDLKTSQFLLDRSMEILDAAGARKKWVSYPAEEQQFTAHLLGICRMGQDSGTSVIDSDHRTHDVRNLFICDGSSMVTSGRGQPTMTIMALAFRAGERMAGLAKWGEI